MRDKKTSFFSETYRLPSTKIIEPQRNRMKLFIVCSAALATVVLASPAENVAADIQVAQDGAAPAGCHWEGTAPFCAGSCTQGYTEIDRGSCGDGACCITGIKTLCCTKAATAAAKKKIANAKAK